MVNNAPKVQAFNSYYAQAKSLYAAGDLSAARELLYDKAVYSRMARPSNIYGDGRVGERICELLLKI